MIFSLQAARNQIRFNNTIEIALFKECLSVNPFACESNEVGEAWSKVGENTSNSQGLKKIISARTAKEKVDQQLDYFRADNKKNLKK